MLHKNVRAYFLKNIKKNLLILSFVFYGFLSTHTALAVAELNLSFSSGSKLQTNYLIPGGGPIGLSITYSSPAGTAFTNCIPSSSPVNSYWDSLNFNGANAPTVTSKSTTIASTNYQPSITQQFGLTCIKANGQTVTDIIAVKDPSAPQVTPAGNYVRAIKYSDVSQPPPVSIADFQALPANFAAPMGTTNVRVSYLVTGALPGDVISCGNTGGSMLNNGVGPVYQGTPPAGGMYSTVSSGWTSGVDWSNNPLNTPGALPKSQIASIGTDIESIFNAGCTFWGTSAMYPTGGYAYGALNPTGNKVQVPSLRLVPTDSGAAAPTSVAQANGLPTTITLPSSNSTGRLTYYGGVGQSFISCTTTANPSNASWSGISTATSSLQHKIPITGLVVGNNVFTITCTRPNYTTATATATIILPAPDLKLIPTDWTTGSAPTTLVAANAASTTITLPSYNSTGRITYYSPSGASFSSCATVANVSGPTSNPTNSFWNSQSFTGANMPTNTLPLKNKGSITGMASGTTTVFALTCIKSNGVPVTATAQITLPPQPAQDLCPNIAGVQATLPAGYVIDANGSCVPDLRMVPTDVANSGPTTIAAANTLPTSTTFADTSHQGRLTYYSPAGAQYSSCVATMSSPSNGSWSAPLPAPVNGSSLANKFPITNLQVGANSFVITCTTASGATASVTATINVAAAAIDLRLVPTDSTLSAPATVNAANTAPTTITLPNTNSTARLTYYSPTGAVFSQCSVSPAGPSSTPINSSWNGANFTGANIADATLKHKTPITSLVVGQNDFVLKCVKNGALVTATATVNVTTLGIQQTIRIVPLDHVITAPEIANFANLPTTITVTTPTVRLYYNAPNNTTGALSGCFGLGTNVSSQYLSADFTSAGHDPVQTVREVFPTAPMPLAQTSPNQFQISCLTPGVTSNTATVNFNLPAPTLALAANPVGPLNPGSYFTTLTWTTNNASAWVANSCNGVGGGASSGWVTNGKPAPTTNGVGSSQSNVYVAANSVTFMVTCTTTPLYGSQQISAQVTVTRNPPSLSFDSLHCPPTAPFHANDYSYNWTSNFASGTVCTNPSTSASANPVPQVTLTKPNTGNGVINSVGTPVYYISCRDMNVPGNASPVQIVNTQMSIGQYNVVYPSYGYSYCYCPPNPTPTETLCSNGIDDDCDGYTDTQDTDCSQGATTGATATGTATSTATATATAGATSGIPGKPKIKEN